MTTLDFPVFDADNHLYEAEDAFTRHLPPAHANLFRFAEINGRKKLVVRNNITEFIPNPTFEVVARPGAHMAFYGAENPEGRTLRELTGKPIACLPAFRQPGPRLELLDQQGVYASLVFPTLASLIEQRLLDDPELTQVAIHAFNEWLYDEWSFDHQGRLFTTPIVNPCLLDQGIAELELLIERGRGPCCCAPRRSAGGAARARPSCPSSIPSGPASRRRACWWRCTPPTAATRTTSTPGRAPTASTWPSGP